MSKIRPIPAKLLRVALPLAVIVLALAIFAGLRATRPQIPAAAPVERTWTVAAVPATLAAATPTLVLYGEITSGREAELRPLVSGPVVETSPQLVEGGRVRAGDLLLAIDPSDYHAAVDELRADLDGERGQLVTDREQQALAEAEVARRQRLAGSGAGSEKTLDDARQALSAAKARVIARTQGIARREIQLAKAERALADTHLLAPFDGFLTDIGAAPGKQVGTNDRVARLIDAGRLEARFHLSDTQYAGLSHQGGIAGRAAVVVWDAGGGETRFNAVVERVQGKVDPASGGVAAFARLIDAGLDTVIRPGTFVRVEVPDHDYDQVVRLPLQALHGHDTVYVVAAAGDGALRLAAQAVEAVARDGSDVLVRGDFADGAVIVVTRFPEMGPGVKVRIADGD